MSSNGESIAAGGGGFWGQRTATIDWCEANYEITHYIAEFWNTVSNLVMILFPLYGIYWSFRHRRAAERNRSVFRVPSSVIWCHFGLMLVGFGSWAFHMTLLYPMQLLDELPMIYCSGILVYANYDLILSSFQFDTSHHNTVSSSSSSISSQNTGTGISCGRESRWRQLLHTRRAVLAVLVGYCVLVTYVYLHVWKNPIFHEIAYSVMVLAIVAENVLLIRRYRLSRRLYMISLAYYLFGFFLWNVDNKFCAYLQRYRSSIEAALGVRQSPFDSSTAGAVALNTVAVLVKSMSELHSLWHIFTGYASYMTILFLTEVHYEFHLLTVCKKSDGDAKTPAAAAQQRPVGNRWARMYYHLTNSLLSTAARSATDDATSLNTAASVNSMSSSMTTSSYNTRLQAKLKSNDK